MKHTSLGTLALSVESGERPPGLHVSDIIKDMLLTVDSQKYGKPMDWTKVGCGVVFEQAVAARMPWVFRPAPIWVPIQGSKFVTKYEPTSQWIEFFGAGEGGIWCSPDGLNPQRGCCPVEFKCTWYSASKEFPSDPVYWPWLVQVKAYCHAVGSQVAELWVQYANGDYKPPKPQEPQGWLLEFTQLDIEENWVMLTNWAKSKGWL